MPTEEMRGIPFDSKLQTAEDGSMYEDREIFSADIAEYFGYLSTNGICIREGESLNNQLKITAGTAGAVVFNPGAIKIQGRMGWMEEAVEKQTEAGGTKPRYDTAVIELNLSSSERRFIPKIIKGVEADSPVPPTLTQTANIYQLGLANIYRAANSIALGTITDTRSDSQRCGISKVAIPNVPDDVINLWASQYPGVVSLADILTKISTEGLPVPFGGTGKTTAAEAAKVLGVGDYCFIKISGDTGTWSTTGGKVETLSISSQQGQYFTDNKNSTFKVNKACNIKTSGTIQLTPAASGTAVSLEVDLKKGSTDVSYCRVVMDPSGGRSTEAFGTDVITLAAGDVLSFFAKASVANKVKIGGQTRFLFEVIPV